MAQLSYINRLSPPSEHAHVRDSDAPERNMGQNTTNSSLQAAMQEARQWKLKHDKVRETALSIGYKAENLQQAFNEYKTKHQNLQQNHTAMQANYTALKNELARTREQGDKTLQSATKWKSRCEEQAQQQLDLSKSFEKKMKAHGGELDELREALANEKAKNKELRATLEDQTRKYRNDLKNLRTEQEVRAAIEDATKKHQAELKRLHTDRELLHQELEDLYEEWINAEHEHEITRDSLRGSTQENAALTKKLRAASQDADELAAIKKDLPSVNARLRELKALKNESLHLSPEEEEELFCDFIDSQTENDALHTKLASMEKEASNMASQIQTLKKDSDQLADLKKEMSLIKSQSMAEKMRAAKQPPSVNAQLHEQQQKEIAQYKAKAMKYKEEVNACAHMLRNAHKVLDACADYQANKDDPNNHVMHQAMNESARNIATFIQNLENTQSNKGPLGAGAYPFE